MSQQWTPPPPPTAAPATVPNYLIPAILSVFCCWPLAIVAIIFAAQVNGKVLRAIYRARWTLPRRPSYSVLSAIGLGMALDLIYMCS